MHNTLNLEADGPHQVPLLSYELETEAVIGMGSLKLDKRRF